MANNFYVEIREYGERNSASKVVKEMGPFSEHQAEKVDDGANINLNHDGFYTLIVQKPEHQEQEP